MKNNKLQILTNGIIKENPILVLILGTCTFLAVTTKAFNAIGMGAAVTFVLLCSNVMISLLRKVISDKLRIPCYIVVIASFVTLVQMIVKAFLPALVLTLGLFLPGAFYIVFVIFDVCGKHGTTACLFGGVGFCIAELSAQFFGLDFNRAQGGG